MNREIKFRAWHKELQDMIYYPGMVKNDRMAAYPISKMFKLIESYPDMYEIMQFIAVKDKNGKDIYDGDILKNTRDERLFNWVVLFQNGCFGIKNIGVDGYLGDFYPCDSQYYFTDREVIGNIYENPDLK